MPLYAYECDKCGVRFDRRQVFDDEPVRVCPECRGKVHRLIQPAGVIFKGGGFYSTDHKGSSSSKTNGGAKETTASDGAAKSDSPKSDTAKSEPKSESASESKPAAPAKAATSDN